MALAYMYPCQSIKILVINELDKHNKIVNVLSIKI